MAKIVKDAEGVFLSVLASSKETPGVNYPMRVSIVGFSGRSPLNAGSEMAFSIKQVR